MQFQTRCKETNHQCVSITVGGIHRHPAKPPSKRRVETLQPLQHFAGRGRNAKFRSGSDNLRGSQRRCKPRGRRLVPDSPSKPPIQSIGHGETHRRDLKALRPSPRKGALVSNRSLTIVLPVYNGESQLTNCVNQMLELASDLTSQFSIMIVDDGSTDDTSAVAYELSSQYPQVTVERRRHRSGLGPIISMVRRRIDSDVVIMHDGVTPIDSVQVRRLWRQSDAQSSPTVTNSKRDLSDLTRVRATQNAMAAVHDRVMGFHLLEPLDTDATANEPVPTRTIAAAGHGSRAGKPKPARSCNVGHIPSLPRPNFLSAIAEFTLGE